MSSPIRRHIADALQQMTRLFDEVAADRLPDPAQGRPNPVIEAILDMRDYIVDEQEWIRATLPEVDDVRDRAAMAMYRMGCAAFDARSSAFLAEMSVEAYYRNDEPPDAGPMGHAMAMLLGMGTLLTEFDEADRADGGRLPH
jgi:hypothetical protein